MTGYTVHTGSTEKFAAGWDEIFKKGRPGRSAGTKESSAKKKSHGSAKRSQGRRRRKK
ncbi:MAG TPA: hypothetical protein VKU82_10930 [Planctomycetaceae bacterium]|nr:hypothetical protein [Planctomycetaceae bacterium]